MSDGQELETDVFTRDIREYAAKISFDPSVIVPTGDYSVENTLSEDFKIYYKQVSSDCIKIYAYGDKLEGNGILINLCFYVHSEPGSESALDIQSLEFYGNSGDIKATWSSGTVRVVKQCFPD